MLFRSLTCILLSYSTSCDSVLDQQDLPRVISYKELGQGSLNDLVTQPVDQGSHVSLDGLKSGIAIESIFEGGVTEKEKTAASSIAVGNSNTQPVASAGH